MTKGTVWKMTVPFVVEKKPNQLLGPHKPDKSKRRDFHSLCVSLNSCEEISVSTVLFVDPGYFVLVAEVVEADQFFLLSFSYQCEQSFVPGFQGVGRDFRGEYGVTVPDDFQLLQTVENASLDGLGVSTVLARTQLKWPLWSQRGSAALDKSVL